MARKKIEHGLPGYRQHKCRCDTCRGAWNDYMRRYKRMHATPSQDGYFRDKVPVVRVKLTRLGLNLLEARLAERKGWTLDDVVEQALRCDCGHDQPAA